MVRGGREDEVNQSIELEGTRLHHWVSAPPAQQPCLGSLGESASSLSVASWLSTSSAVSGVTNWCSTASAMILWVIFLFLTAVGARDLHGVEGKRGGGGHSSSGQLKRLTLPDLVVLVDRQDHMTS